MSFHYPVPNLSGKSAQAVAETGKAERSLLLIPLRPKSERDLHIW